MGSVFSPYYAWARRSGPADPGNHCAINVALYNPASKTWNMTERGRGAVVREPTRFVVGPSSMNWDDGVLVIGIDEISVPFPRSIRGTVRIKPRFFCAETVVLAKEPRHCWRPIAPVCDVDVKFDSPQIAWKGTAYLDSNWGDSPLENAFDHWTWSRSSLNENSLIYYDVKSRDGERSAFSLAIDGVGRAKRMPLPPVSELPKTLWRLPRSTFSNGAARIVRTLEDAPFYSRSLIQSEILGKPALSVHECLSLRRFRLPIVQAMLPFRMPRRGGGRQPSLSRRSL